MKNIIIYLLLLLTTLASKELNVAFSYDKPPYTFSKDTKIGIEPELMKKALEPLGYKINVIQMPKYYLENILYQDNSYDAASSVTPKKGDGLFYSDRFTYYENYAITRKKDHISIKSIDDLKSVDFVSWNSSYNDLGPKFHAMFNPVDGKYKERYHQNPSQMEDARMFFNGDVDAILVDKNIFKWYTTYFNIKDNFEYHKIFPKKKWYHVAFRSKKVRDDFNEGLKRLRRTGEYRRILNYYLTHDLTSIIKLANVLAEIVSPYLYKLDRKTAQTVLEKFIKDDNILSISIIDNKLGKVFVSMEKKHSDIGSAEFEKEISYKSDNSYSDLGKVKVVYKRDFDFKGKNPVPPIEDFYLLQEKDLDRIRAIYKNNGVMAAKPIELSEDEKSYLKRLKSITVHNEKLWAPYNFNIDGEARGFVIDYMNLLGRKLGLKIEYVSGYSWNEFLDLIKAKRIDVIANIVDTPDRRAYIYFTKPYITSKKAIFSNEPGLKHFPDLIGKTVAVPKGFYIERFLKERYPGIKLKTYRDVLSCIVGVLNGEADAVVESYSVINYLLQKNDLEFKYMTLSEDKELQSKLSIGVAKDKKILRDILQKAIESVSKDEMLQLRQKWFGIKERGISIYSDEEYKYIKSMKYLKICTNPNWKPIEFTENGKAQGISIDVINIISNKLGVKSNFITSKSWADSQKLFSSGECDILPAAVYTREREKFAYFTKPYLSYKLAIITSEDKPIVTSIDAISDKVMARKRKSGIIDIMKRRYPGLKVLEVDSYEDAFEKVENGEAYFTLATLPILSYYQYRHGLKNLKVAGYLDMSYDLSIAVNKSNYLLYNIIEKTLSTIPKSTVDIINDRWTTFKVIKTVDYIFILKIVAVLLLIIVIILIAYFKLKKLHTQIDMLNRTLEERVMEEVIKNRNKDKILIFQDRLAKMGEIISMIAHQWRQPLNNISILHQILLLKYKKGTLDDEAMEKFSKDANRQIQMMSDTIDHFRDFFKPEKSMHRFELGSLVKDMANMLKPVLEKENIELITRVEDRIEILGYRNELGQSVISILNNAKDALISNRERDRKIVLRVFKRATKAIVRIEDNAGGIPDDILDKLCEPYFSTKESKNGTGIGLYMAKMIVEEHMHGELNYFNENDGAVFEIVLDLSKDRIKRV